MNSSWDSSDPIWSFEEAYKKNSWIFSENHLIWIQFRYKLKTIRTRGSLKMKILFWNKVTFKVSIKIKIIPNKWDDMIIFSKKKQVFWINLIEFEVKSRRFNEKLDWR